LESQTHPRYHRGCLYHFVIALWSAKDAESAVKYWEIIADNLSKTGWSWGCVAAVTREGEIIWGLPTRIAAMESVFVVHADEKLSAFVELEAARFVSGQRRSELSYENRA
jgi:hypothetical protein